MTEIWLLTGQELDALTDEELDNSLEKISDVCQSFTGK